MINNSQNHIFQKNIKHIVLRQNNISIDKYKTKGIRNPRGELFLTFDYELTVLAINVILKYRYQTKRLI